MRPTTTRAAYPRSRYRRDFNQLRPRAARFEAHLLSASFEAHLDTGAIRVVATTTAASNHGHEGIEPVYPITESLVACLADQGDCGQTPPR